MPRRRPAHTRPRGFTLMEIVIGVVLLGMLAVVGTTMLTSGFYTSRTLTNEHLGLATARYALERMGREIREIKPDPGTGAPMITVMQPGELRFTRSDLSANGTEVRFVYTSPSLGMAYPATNASAVDLAPELSALTFSYLDANSQPAATADAVRFVRIDMKVKPTQAQELRLLTQVGLRNL